MKRGLIFSGFSIMVVIALAWLFWMWVFCRFYVPPNHMAVITAKIGDPLPPGQILAREGQLGVRENVLSEGRHFLNPIFYDRKIVPLAIIEPGKVGIVTSKVGKDLPQGEFLANKGEKGIWREALGPGKYRLIPEGYNIEIIDAISIPIGYVGVMTSLSGQQAPEGQFAGSGQKGVRKDILQPGLYYINPKAFKIDVLEIGLNQVSLLGTEGGQIITKTRLSTQNQAMDKLVSNVFEKQLKKREEYFADSYASRSEPMKEQKSMAKDRQRARRGSKPAITQIATGDQTILQLAQGVEFPSRDGFEIDLDMTVEFELLPKNISYIYRSFGDLPAVVDKIIMPQIQSISRLKGSAYRAIDFIVGEGREKFQDDLRVALQTILDHKNIVIHNALIRHVSVPAEILDPIQKSSIATQVDLTNKEKQNTARKKATLNQEISLIEQRGKQVLEETQKIKAEIAALREKEVATIAANTGLRVSEINKETATVKASTTEKLGKAHASVIELVDGEIAHGFELHLKAVNNPVAYNLFKFSKRLSPELRVQVLHSGEGTLWTDLDKPKLADMGAGKNLNMP